MFFQGRSVSIHSHIFFGTHHWIKNYLIRIAQLTFTHEASCTRARAWLPLSFENFWGEAGTLRRRISKVVFTCFKIQNTSILCFECVCYWFTTPSAQQFKRKKSRFVTLLDAHYFKNYRVKNLLLHNILNKNSFWPCNLLILHFRRILT